MQYLRARYYNTKIGRFIQKDEYKGDFTQPSTLNRYVYCGGNPVNRMDPSGNLVTQADIDAASEDYTDQQAKTEYYRTYRNKAKSIYKTIAVLRDRIEDELREAARKHRNASLKTKLELRNAGIDIESLKERVDELSKILVESASLESESLVCYNKGIRKLEESEKLERQAKQAYYNALELYQRNEIYYRMANMKEYKGKDSEALGILKSVLESEATLGMSTTELMIQYALQFTGEEEAGLDMFSSIEKHTQLPYDTVSGNSFDRYDDCSGFVQELYYVFYDVKLGFEKGKNITSGGVDHQFNQINANDQNYLIKTDRIDFNKIQAGQLIYYDYNTSSKAYKNAWDSDHVVMYLGRFNGKELTIQESFKGGGVVVKEADITHVVGFTQNIQDRK